MHLLSSAILSEGSIIDLDWTIAVQLAVFGVAFLVLRALVFKPLIAVFEAREAAIEGAKEEAVRLQSESEDAGEEFENEMRRVRLVAGEEREKLRAEGQKTERLLLQKVREETNKQLSDAEAKLKVEELRVRRDIEASVPLLAKDIATKLLEREVA